MKIIIAITLLVSSFFLYGCTSRQPKSTESESADAQAEKLEVIHFHGTVQCWSCETVGEYTKYTLETNFSKELADGTISFQSINSDLSENTAIVNKYQSSGSSLYINAIYDGQDHISEDVTVWRMIGSQSQFETYLRDKINQLLGE